MSERLNIYQMYMQNSCRLGFYVKRDTWRPGRFARVIAIQWVEDGKPIKGKPPYYGGFKNPPGHPRAGKIMGPREVTLQADWFDDGVIMITDCGGNYCWTRVYPDWKAMGLLPASKSHNPDAELVPFSALVKCL